MVLAIDARRSNAPTVDRWEVVVDGGRTPTGIDAVEWAVRGVEAGAGEILLTSMDADGTLNGYDIELNPRGCRSRPRSGDRLGRRRDHGAFRGRA